MLLKKIVSEKNPQTVAELIDAQLKTGQLTSSELKTQVFGWHWRDESLHEVLEEIGAKLDKETASEIIEYLTAQNGQQEKFINLFLAAKCLLKVKDDVNKTTEKKLLNAVKKLSQYGTGFLILYQSAQELQETYQIRYRSIGDRPNLEKRPANPAMAENPGSLQRQRRNPSHSSRSNSPWSARRSRNLPDAQKPRQIRWKLGSAIDLCPRNGFWLGRTGPITSHC